MFNKMKLRTYLLTVFSIIILLTGFITAVGTLGLVKTSQNADVLVEKILTTDAAVKTCRIEVNIAARNLREMILTDDTSTYSSFNTQINNSMNKIQEQIALFKTVHGESDGLAKKYEDAFMVWFSIANRAIRELEIGNRETAREIVLNECSPALNNLVSIAQEIDQVISAEKLEQQTKTTELITIFTTSSVIAFIFVLIISIYFAVRTTTNITGAVNKIKDAVLELSKGNLKTKVNYNAQNEFGELSERMNFSFQELSRYIDAIDQYMSEFSKGNFVYHNPMHFLGDFAHIQTSIRSFRGKMNDTLIELGEVSDQVNAGAVPVSYTHLDVYKRQASTAAFNAKILVWKAISSIVLVIFPILSELAEICSIACTICCICAPHCSICRRTCCIIESAWAALLAVLPTCPETLERVAVNVSMACPSSSAPEATT